MNANPLLAAAQNYVQVGLSVIPVSVKTKKPTAKWKVFQNRLPTDNELKKGFAQAGGLAVVCGAVSGNLEILDFDLKAELFPNWQRLVEEEAPGLLSRLAIQKSQNQGRHAFYRCPALSIPGNKTFAQRPIDVSEDVKSLLLERGVNFEDGVSNLQQSLEVTHAGKRYSPRLVDGKFIIVVTLIETRGAGGYFLAHPSPGYELLQGDFFNIPTISLEERQILINASLALNEWIDPAKVEGFGYRLPTEARRPGDDFNERCDIAEFLNKHGWEPVGVRGAYQHYRRPGKDQGQSASLIDGRWFHVFTSNGNPFEACKTYSPFAVFALLEHDGDFKKAAGELAKKGYGEKQSTKKRTEGKAEIKKNPKQTEMLQTLAAEADLFHTPDYECYARIPVKGHKETWPIRSKGFRRWLMRKFYETEGKPPNSEALQAVLGLLEAQAQFDGPACPVFVRVAEYEGSIFLDLANESWEAIKISANGWEVVPDPPVCFRRARSMAALPHPEKGGDIDELRYFVNVEHDSDFKLVVGVLVAALSPSGPYPVTLLQSGQGRGKTTMSRVIRSLIDPSTSPVRAAPKEVRDVMISATNGWFLAFDNLSGLQDWLSDCFCRLSTGGGFATRELYTDSEEIVFEAQRPVILNGIDNLANRQDLADRAIVINLPEIKDEDRRPEKEFWVAFNKARPRILEALLNAVKAALRNRHKVNLPTHPRMADFAVWVTAAESGLGWPPDSFLEAYKGNQKEAVELSLEADVVAVAVRALMAERDRWEGKPSELYEALKPHVPEDTLKSKAWPKAPNILTSCLKRASTGLQKVGIKIEFGKSGDRKTTITRQGGKKSDRSAQSAQAQENQEDSLDAPQNRSVRPESGSVQADNGDVKLDASPDGTDAFSKGASTIKGDNHVGLDSLDASGASLHTFKGDDLRELDL